MVETNYDILGVAEGSSKKEIHNAFRQLALQFHSDRGGENRQFIRIRQAYEDLKVGKKYPDTEDERLRNSKVFSGDVDADVIRRNQILGQEIYKEMMTAEEWAAALNRANMTGTRLFGSKTLGEIELERKANGALSIKGNFMAGSLTYDGPVMMRGSVTSPSWTPEYRTQIRLLHGDFKMMDPTENKYKIENGATLTVENGNAVVGNVFGRKYRVGDQTGKVGVFDMKEYRTRIAAPNGKIIAENLVNTVSVEADTVIVLNVEDDVEITAREILFYGGKMTYDTTIRLKRGGVIRFFERFSIQGLSGDATITLEDSRTVRLFNLKTKKIRSLPDELVPDMEEYAKDATMVGNGFTITYEMLERLPVATYGAGGQKRRRDSDGGSGGDSGGNDDDNDDNGSWASKFGFGGRRFRRK